LCLVALALLVLMCGVAAALASPGGGRCIPRWRIVADERGPDLVAAVALSPADVWAVGSTFVSGVERLAVDHWNGTRWQTVRLPRVRAAEARLTGIAARSASDVWAVGEAVLRSSSTKAIFAHWDGTRWRLVGTRPVGADASFDDVATESRTGVWVVGSSLVMPLVARWNG